MARNKRRKASVGTSNDAVDICGLCTSIVAFKTLDCCLLPLARDKSVASVTICPHRFHTECIKKWSELETTCPQCKVIFDTIECKCPKTGKVLETIKCSTLFLWDHQESQHEALQENTSEQTTSTLALLTPQQLQISKAKGVKRVSVEKALDKAKKTLEKITAVNTVAKCDLKTEIKPLRKEKIKLTTSFNLTPVYQDDFIAK